MRTKAEFSMYHRRTWRRLKRRQLFDLEWDAIAGVVAAVIALILHMLHVVTDSVLDEDQRQRWQRLRSRIDGCQGHAKVRKPRWGKLEKTTSYILGDNQASGGMEALLSFWGEPFMSKDTRRDIPRFIFHVQKGSELLPHLVELSRAKP